MDDSRGIAETLTRSRAGIITRIRLENFMCHSSLEIELGDWVNFITGQNGSTFLYCLQNQFHYAYAGSGCVLYVLAVRKPNNYGAYYFWSVPKLPIDS